MRTWLLPTAILAVGCASHPGTYLDVSGDVMFDHVEVYVGHNAGEIVPTTPGHPDIVPSTVRQRLVQRDFVDSDIAMTSPTTDWSDYLPATGANLDLGAYVLIVASRGGSVVGIGELFDFVVPTDAIYRYEIKLSPPADGELERWGRPQADCVRVARPRGDPKPEIVAVVRGDDNDCDNFRNQDPMFYDCDSQVYCDGNGGRGCAGRGTCMSSASAAPCTVGACANQDGVPTTCEPEVCVESGLCNYCAMSGAPTLLDCAVVTIGTHNDYPVPLKQGYVLCSDPEPYSFVLRLPQIQCLNPQIVGFNNPPLEPDFRYSIQPGPTPNDCIFTIKAPTPGAAFDFIPHILIAVDNPSGSPLARTEFAIGLDAALPLGACTVGQVDTVVADFSMCGSGP